MTYLIRVKRREGVSYATIEPEDLGLCYRPIRETVRVLGGMFREMRDTGEDRTRVHISLRRGRAGDGRPASGGTIVEVKLSAPGEVVRRLDDDAKREVEGIDFQILGLHQQVTVLRARRRAVLASSWRRSVPVFGSALRELEASNIERHQTRQAREALEREGAAR